MKTIAQQGLFSQAELRGANLQRADLRGADLRGADLLRAFLQRANLQGGVLRGAFLYEANLQGANLQRADLPQAMRAIASLRKKIIHTESTVIYETEIKLWNKPASVRMAGEHLGLFKGSEQPLPDIHVHVYTARERLADRLTHLATRHAEDSTNGS